MKTKIASLVLIIVLFISSDIFSKDKAEGVFYPIKKSKKKIKIDCKLLDWDIKKNAINIGKNNIEKGFLSGKKDFSGKFYFTWNKKYLYMAVVIDDNEIVADMSKDRIWRNDCIELYIDPERDGFIWNDDSDFQFGFSPSDEKQVDKAKTWEWFHGDNNDFGVKAVSKLIKKKGYIIEAAIPWETFDVEPEKKKIIGVGFGIHDVDIQVDDSPDTKLIWGYFASESSIRLAGFILE